MRNAFYLPREVLLNLYSDKRLSMKKIGELYNQKPQTIMRLIHKYHIKINKYPTAWNSGKTYNDDPRILAKEKHPRHLYTIYYNSDFKRLRKKILPCKCNNCTSPAIVIHHDDLNKMNNNINNLKPFCRSCHSTLHNSDRGTTVYDKICQYCGKIFHEKNNKVSIRKFCSLRCSAKFNYHITKATLARNRKGITMHTLYCKYCSKEIITPLPKQIFCSCSCSSKHTHLLLNHIVS